MPHTAQKHCGRIRLNFSDRSATTGSRRNRVSEALRSLATVAIVCAASVERIRAFARLQLRPSVRSPPQFQIASGCFSKSLAFYSG